MSLLIMNKMSENLYNKPKTHICRLCLAATTTFFSLMDNQESAGMLEALTSLRILSDDFISTVMCLKCRLNLKLAYTIQQNMLRAEQRFRQKLEMKQKFEEITEDFQIINPDSSDNEESKESDDIQNVELETINLDSPNTTDFEIINSDSPKEEDEKCEPEKQNVERKDPVFSLLKTYTCDICGKTKYSQAEVHKHKHTVHVKLKCPICNKEYGQSNFKRHVERHSSPSTICDICGATIKSVHDLRCHMRYAHSKTIHKCQFCDKVFKGLASKKKHENREHIGQPKFVCDVCGKKFYTAANLKTHTNMKHLKLRPYVCEFCNVGFASKYSLKTHSRQHTKETPYRCEVCGEGFRQKVSLKSHRKSKHQIEEECTVECKTCGKKFATKAALYSHQRLH